MKKMVLTSLVVLWLAASTLVSVDFVSLIGANAIPPDWVPMEHAYIRSNGDIDPPTLPIQRMGDVYRLTDNMVNYTIDIEKDGVVFDGNGFLIAVPKYDETDDASLPIYITGDPSIVITGKSNVTIKNAEFSNCFFGVETNNSSNILIIQNTITNSNMGIHMTSCSNCSIIGNEITNAGIRITDSSLLNVAYNRISNFGVTLSASYSNITRNEFSNSSEEALLLHGDNSHNDLFENNFVNNEIGLLFRGDIGTNVNNSVFSNYWSNNGANIKNVDESGNPYAETSVDPSPLNNPVSTSYIPFLFPFPSPEPTDLPTQTAATTQPTQTTDDSGCSLETFWMTVVVVAIAVSAFSVVLLLRKNRRRHA